MTFFKGFPGLMWVLLLGCTQVQAFQILPKVSDVDRKLAEVADNTAANVLGQFVIRDALSLLKSPVHEAITLVALGCPVDAGNEKYCLTQENIATHRTLLYGVRWPDDPPFRLNVDTPPKVKGCNVKVTVRSTSQPLCWNGLFADAGKKAQTALPNAPAYGPGDYLLYRSHYGDLQFFHSMAVHDGELAQHTAAKMKRWAQFLWGLAIGQTPVGQYIRVIDPDGMGQYFAGDITPTNLLSTGIVEVRKDLDKVATGVLLHMVQDSFSAAHTQRGPESGERCADTDMLKPGAIYRFHSYAGQDSRLHDEADTLDALSLNTLETQPSVVEVAAGFLRLVKAKAPWSQAEKAFDCVFDVQDHQKETAGPGPFVKGVKTVWPF